MDRFKKIILSKAWRPACRQAGMPVGQRGLSHFIIDISLTPRERTHKENL